MSSINKKKVLVAGGAGFIGSHVAVELLENGYDVLIGDNFYNSSPDVIDRIEKITNFLPEFLEIDFCRRDDTVNLFLKNPDIQSVILLAGYKAAGESVDDPLKYYQNNLLSAQNIIEASLKHGSGNFIFSSSAAVYGNPDLVPIKESAPLKKPLNPYGNTKKIIEEILYDVCQSAGNDFKAIALRYFNAAGAHPGGLLGELPKGKPDNLIPFITQTAAGIREELKIFGNDYDTKDGTCIRDYIHVCDLATAHLKALQRLEQGKNENKFEIYNIGTGKGVSVLEAVAAFEDVNHQKINYKISDRRKGDPDIIFADPSLAEQKLGWKAEKNILDIMRDAWNWEKKLRGFND
jgi:UDP-glucose 4-epimerase